MPEQKVQKYRVETDKGVFEVEVEVPDLQTAKNDALKAANAKPLKEPTTFMGGVMKGLDEFAGDLGRSAFESMAHPTGAGDFLSLMLPGSRIPGLKATAAVPGTVEPVGNKLLRGGAKAGATVLDLTPNIARSPVQRKVVKGLKSLGEPPARFNELPLVKQEPYLPATPAPERKVVPLPPKLAPTAAEVPFHERPLWQQMEDLPETPAPVTARSGMPPVGEPRRAPADMRKAGRTPSMEEVLDEALMESMGQGTESAAGKSLPPPPTITPGGTTRQSGQFGRSEKVGQPGGYTSGRPAVSETQYEQMMRKYAEEGEVLGSDAGAIPSRVPENAPPPSPADVMDPATIAEERRMFGSEGAASRLGMKPEEVTALAPGPSRLPLDAELKIQDARGEAATGITGETKSTLEELLRKIIESRGGRL